MKAAKVDKRKANHHDSNTKSDGTVEDGSDEDSDPEEAAIWKVRLIGTVKPILLIGPIQVMKASLPKADDDDDDDDEGVDDDDDVDEDDSRVDYSTQDLESDEHASSNTDTEEEEASSDAEDDIDVNWEIDSVGSSDVDGSVNLNPLRTRSKLTAYDQARSDTQALPTVSGDKSRKRKERGGEDERTRKKKLRALPTFARYEDYARMIEDGPEENL